MAFPTTPHYFQNPVVQDRLTKEVLLYTMSQPRGQRGGQTYGGGGRGGAARGHGGGSSHGGRGKTDKVPEVYR